MEREWGIWKHNRSKCSFLAVLLGSLFSSGCGNPQVLGSRTDQKQREKWSIIPEIQVCAENTKSTATGDKQDASGYTIRLLVCAPSNGLVRPIAEATDTVLTDKAGRHMHSSRTEASSQPKAQVPYFRIPPLCGWTWTNTIPSVIKVSTQGSRVLHTRGTPAHTGEDIKGRNRNGGRKEETGVGLLGLKRKATVTGRGIYLVIRK